MTEPQAATMSAIVIEGGKGPAEALRLAEQPTPIAAPGELLIRIRAAGLNRADIAQRQGRYNPPPGASAIMGMEVAGEVVQAAGRWKVGDRVCALLGGGGYAQYVACDPRHALPIPEGFGWAEAAGLPETIITVFANVFEHGALQAGETFMIHGATSGIGVTAIQMAKAQGAKVVATARGAGKAQSARAYGADVVIDATTEDFAAVAKAEGGVDVVLDMVGPDYFARNLDALKTGGRIVFIASPTGTELTVPIWALMAKRAVVTGSTLRARSADEKARLVAEVERRIWPWVASGRVRPPIDRTFPLSAAAQAHACMEGGDYVGKLVLTVD